MEFNSVNPYDGRVLAMYNELSTSEILTKLEKANEAFRAWSQESLDTRTKLLARAGKVLRDNIEEYAKMIALEVGKPISESRSEITKCAWVCDYYAENAAEFLRDEIVETEAHKSYVKHDPIGTVLAIMPWNFPFWQVFRFAAPTLAAGNTGLLKHAPNVFGCAIQIEEVFKKAGFPEGVFQNLIVHHDKTEQLIAHDSVKAITLTGSEGAGAAVAELAGKYLKKCVLELGGNNAFVVWKDADIDRAVKTAVTARMLNGGQSCIAAKRFILVDEIHDEFLQKFTEAVSRIKAGNPLDDDTQIGPLARKDLADKLDIQVKGSTKMGAKLIAGGNQSDCFYSPTILAEVKPGMPAFDEETFGPLACMVKAKDEKEAFELAAKSKYGLGMTVFTKDVDRALTYASRVEDGAYFINELVKSDPRLPFGGTKRSGYGRELAKDGIMEFVNRKTIYVA